MPVWVSGYVDNAEYFATTKKLTQHWRQHWGLVITAGSTNQSAGSAAEMKEVALEEFMALLLI